MTPNVHPQVRDLLARMTLEEKLAQLNACWMRDLLTDGRLDADKLRRHLRHGIGQITRPGGSSALPPDALAEAANQIQRFLVEETRLGIPAILHEECCAGAMVRQGTIFPQPIGLASAFQPDLIAEMTEAIRRQLRAVGLHHGLAPVLDLARDPRWGRLEETFGEDPLLVARCGVAYVRGLQGDDLRDGVMATGKHFIGHSASQGGLNCAPAWLGRHELFEAYLLPFQAAIQAASLAAIMNAYPELDGEVVAASRRLLTDLLRETLGFDGLVVSDYEAIKMIHTYHFAAESLRRAAVLAIQAGIDIELPTPCCYGDLLRQALEAGEVDMATLDQAVSRNLQKKFELGLFERPYVEAEHAAATFADPRPRALARRLARQSLVLLKNDGLLPLPRDLRALAVIGPNAHDARNLLGDYTYPAHLEDQFPAETAEELTRIPTVLDGIRALAAPGTQVRYARGCDNLDPSTDGFAEAVHAAEQADAVVLVLGDRSGLTPRCTSGETRDSASLRLPGAQEALVEAILATGKPVALALVTGRPYVLTGLAPRVQAILQAWLPGEEGGLAIAEALFGEVNPGGKLPVTFPRSAGQVPIFYNHKPSASRSNWHGDYMDESVRPLYPFGHGLSYTHFGYGGLIISPAQVTRGEQVDISLEVCNSGERAGDEVVQLYVRDEYASLPRPVKELKGFARLTLAPGERRRVTFHLPADALAFYDADLRLVLEPGRIQVMVGSSSEDIRLTGAFEIVGEGPMPVGRRVWDCPVSVA
ncbi:MAG: beta-glucosidase [Candidatus Roseilinea sp.]|nr:MAG: beta-glucosidase [Candidatus Roseilinea sp.]